jgi:hypothetical protein
MTRIATLFVTFAAIGLVAASAQAAVITTTAIGDTSVAGTEQSHTARGLATSVHISNNAGSGRAKGYLIFDLSEWKNTPEFAEQSATFRVHFLGTGSGNGTGQAFAVRGLNAGFTETATIKTNWNEATLVPSTAPGNADFSGFAAGTTTQFATRGGTAYDFTGAWEITVPKIGDYLQSDGTMTLIIVGTTDATNRNHYLGGRQNSNAAVHPSLTFTVIPEPASLALLSAGSLLIGVRGRGRVDCKGAASRRAYGGGSVES